MEYIPSCAFEYGHFVDPNADIWLNIYNDGGHNVATVVKSYQPLKRKARRRKQNILDYLFNELYNDALTLNLRRLDRLNYILNGFSDNFPKFDGAKSFIEKKLENKYKSICQQKRRLKRKVALNKWNYFVTFTYDDKKHNEITFKKKLKKCLSNLAFRRGWRFAGVFERAPETKRLHFHALFYIPDGEMIGSITKHKDFNTVSKMAQTTYINDFFAKQFGRNDFKPLNAVDLKRGTASNYLLKYIGKTNERIFYSKHLPSNVIKKVNLCEVVSEYDFFGKRYVLFDDTITFEKDIMHYRAKQMNFTDYLKIPRYLS